MSRFEEIKIGDSAEIVHKITEKDIERFVELTGDDNKIHIDKTFASNTSFKKPVAHGMLSAAFISTIIGTKIPGDGALWYSQSLEFLLPVRVNDVITVYAEVIGKIERLNAIELKTDIYNQDKQKVIAGKAQVKVIEQESSVANVVVNNINEERKVALVIGATGGIGSRACVKLAFSGFEVAVHYHTNHDKAKQIAAEIKTLTSKEPFVLGGDITSDKEVAELVSRVERRLGNVDLVLNCATVKIPNIKLGQLNWDDLQKQIDINIKANFNLVKATFAGMKERKKGKYIFLTTQYTESTPPVDVLPYVTAKYALNGFAKALAVELAPFNIQVNMVSPGMTDTDLISEIPEKVKMLTAAKTPLKRLAKPEDVAEAIVFLASDGANYMTGETIRINGGQVML
jgi:3-oxoacyl-[acyl-carrier protein] reductase